MKNALIVVSILVLCPFAAQGASFTLSDDALMRLDYKYSGKDTIMKSITDVGGLGVRFDFLYPDPQKIRGMSPSLYFTSCIYGGSGALTGIDIGSFDAFALKFTLVSAIGISSPDEVGPLVVGALINESNYAYTYQPQVISTNEPYPPSATSVTTTDASQIKLIGFTCNIPYWWYNESLPSPWDPDGATISLLVEPAPGAEVIVPEPATLLLLGLGVVILRKRKK